MFRLIVLMENGNSSFFDFFTKDEAIDYARTRNMQANKHIKRHIIKPLAFNQWLKEKGLHHATN